MGMVLLGLVFLTGCQQWPGSQAAKQYQADSERLLGEFRAQKKRADDLAAQNQVLEQRLAESEKGLARQNLAGGRNSRSSGSSPSMRIGEPAESKTSNLSSHGSSRSNSTDSRFRDFENRGLPDARTGNDLPPSMNGLLTSSPGRDTLGGVTGDRSKPAQWRPLPKR